MYNVMMIAGLSVLLSAGAAAQPVLSGSLGRDLSALRLGPAAPASQPPMHADASLFETAAGAEKTSAGMAALYSLVLPGAGEMYVGGFDAGKYPLIAEGALWLTYGTMQYYGTWMRDDARHFASVHAGLTNSSADDQFYVDVSNFANTFDYNEKKLRDRSLDKLYTTPATAWQWDSDANRDQFRTQRVSADRVFNNARFVVGALLVNRIISAINAARLARQFNRSLDSGLGAWRIESSMLGPDGVQVALVRTF